MDEHRSKIGGQGGRYGWGGLEPAEVWKPELQLLLNTPLILLFVKTV
jgi:hypothetical protein